MKAMVLDKHSPIEERPLKPADLPKDAELEYRVIAVNKAGVGQPSNTKMVVL
jgi:hypothetical protein